MLLTDKYNDIPYLAKWKALILDFGVDVPDDLLKGYPSIENYRVKYKVKKPSVENHKFIDKSTNTSVIPAEVIVSANGKKTLVKIGHRDTSPISLILEDGIFHLIEKDSNKKIDLKIELVAKRLYTAERLPKEINPKTPLLDDFVQVVGLDRIAIMAYEGCWHQICKKACRFCDANPKREKTESGLPSLNSLVDFEFNESAWWNSHRADFLAGIEYSMKRILEIENITPHQHFQLMAGNIINTEMVWKICEEIAEVVNKVKPISEFDSYLNLAAPRNDAEKYLKMAKNKMGFNQIEFNLEVIGEERFAEVCPGKAAIAGYANTVEMLKKAVDIFGWGKARSNFVLGAQPVEELLEGIRDLAGYGIVADYSIFVPKRGTPWEKRKSPDMDTVVYFTKELAKIYKKHNFKGIYCGLSSRSNILHEMLDE
ncbi:MAG: radical SAM protein [Candidatus Berkelbacteria bacterium]